MSDRQVTCPKCFSNFVHPSDCEVCNGIGITKILQCKYCNGSGQSPEQLECMGCGSRGPKSEFQGNGLVSILRAASPTALRAFAVVVGFFFVCLHLAPSAKAGNEFRLPFCDDNRVTGWAFYCREPKPEEAPREETQSHQPTEPSIPEMYPSTKAMEEFRAETDEIKHRAVLNPTPENVAAYMERQKLIGDKAGQFTEQWQRVLFHTPHLDANVEYPLAQAGSGIYQDQKAAAEKAALQQVTASSGLLFIFEDSSSCGICRVQGEVLDYMQNEYGVSVLAVSKDGGKNEYFPNSFTDAGRLKELGISEYPAPTLALVEPNSNAVNVIGSGLLTADQILERIYVITQVPMGERY